MVCQLKLGPTVSQTGVCDPQQSRLYDRNAIFAFCKNKNRTQYVQCGGACFAYGSLASGNTDLAIDAGLKPYDLFAPAAITSGAGGIVSDWNGGLLNLNMTGEVVACRDRCIHDSALKILTGKEYG